MGFTVFVTVGSTRFDSLINFVLCEIFVKQIAQCNFTRMVLQVGRSYYNPNDIERLGKNFNLSMEIFDYRDSIAANIREADIVISHAGAGTCLEALRLRRKLIIVANDELMDNHQLELAEYLDEERFAFHAKNVDEILKIFPDACESNLDSFNKFPPKDSRNFERIFDEEIKKVRKIMR